VSRSVIDERIALHVRCPITPAGKPRDEQRTAYLGSKGYRVLRFWNNDVLKEIDSVMEAIYSALRESVSLALVAQESGANSGAEQE
jgi:very-short-patch-repair endonuclease